MDGRYQFFTDAWLLIMGKVREDRIVNFPLLERGKGGVIGVGFEGGRLG